MSNKKRKALAAAETPAPAPAGVLDGGPDGPFNEQVTSDGSEPAPDVDANGDVIDQPDALYGLASYAQVDDGHDAGPHPAEAILNEPTPLPGNVTQLPSQEETEFANSRAIAGDNSKLLSAERAKIFKKVKGLGADLGKGDKSLVGLAAVLCDGAKNGWLQPEAQGKGKEKQPSDAVLMYTTFRKNRAEARGMAAPEDQSAESQSAQASKLNNFIKLGHSNDRFQDPRGDAWATDANELLSNVVELHAQYSLDDKSALRVPSAYLALLAVAKAQLASDQGIWLTEDQVLNILVKPGKEREPKTALDFVKAALKSAEKARDGKADSENSPGRAPLEHANLNEAIAHILYLINDLDPAFTEARAKVEAERLAKQQKASEPKQPRMKKAA